MYASMVEITCRSLKKMATTFGSVQLQNYPLLNDLIILKLTYPTLKENVNFLTIMRYRNKFNCSPCVY